jgi:putative transcriptional regulator
MRRIRKKMKRTRDEFAAQFGFNVARLRDREQGRTHLEAALRESFLAIDPKPEALQESLAV